MKKLFLLALLISGTAHATTFNVTCPNQIKNTVVYGTQVGDWTLDQTTIPNLNFLSSDVFPAGQFQFVYCYYKDGNPLNYKMGTIYKEVKASSCVNSAPKVYTCTK